MEMQKYFYTEKFALIPQQVYTMELGKEALGVQFQMGADASIGTFAPDGSDIVVVYHQSGEGLPFVVRLMEEAAAIEDFNKVAFHYSKERGIAHIIIYTGNELRLANSFKVDSYETALYFLFLSIKGLQMNPRQCVVHICWNIDPAQKQTADRFFKGTQVNDLDTYII